MFKIKRASNRNIVNNDILAESSNNLPQRPPLHQKTFKRPPSAKVARHKLASAQSQQLKNGGENSIEMCREVQQVEVRLTERCQLEQQIRSICSGVLKEKCRRVGELKERMICKVLERAALLLRQELQRDEWRLLLGMVESESDRMIRARQCAAKYESSLSKIQSMLEERINKLSTPR